MGLDKLISAVAVIACMTVAAGQLPRVINAVHRAQVQLIQDSKASKWPKAMLLPIKTKVVSKAHKI
jgi:hypothetical protein